MKILLISMPSIHVTRWIENLKESEHELYWFDILGKGRLKTFKKVHQITNWKYRKITYIKGEYWLKKNKPNFYDKIQPYLERTVNEQLEVILKDINPNIVHSFEMQSCSYPILKTMLKYPKIKWLYSCWGSDIYHYKNIKFYKNRIQKVLNRIDYLHTDCLRDLKLAQQFGFNGVFLGVIPGGGGYKLEEIKKFNTPLEHRKIILVKGYEHHFGRGLNVIKALKELKQEVLNYKIVIFGAHEVLINYMKQYNLPFKVFDRNGLTHNELLELMGKSNIYIGNSKSDGMPNTLLEAIVMNAFPIQSNPGGATAEIIENKLNGLLINNPEDIHEIKSLIKLALQFDKECVFEKAAEINTNIANKRLDFKVNKQKIIELYRNIEINVTKCE
jgi:glycosyltransferase involved in cell wall biosynthesis